MPSSTPVPITSAAPPDAASTCAPALLLNKYQLAAELGGVSVRQIDRLDAAGKLPRCLRIGEAKRWSRAVIEAWVRAGCPGRAEFERNAPKR